MKKALNLTCCIALLLGMAITGFSFTAHAMDVESYLKFGKTQPSRDLPGCRTAVRYDTAGCVVFDKPFPSRQVPLIFVTPTIEQQNLTTDGPASIFITAVNEYGFTWAQKEPSSNSRFYISSRQMTDIHWLAVTPGAHSLPNGQELFAGEQRVSTATNLSRSSWSVVTNDAIDYDAFLTQTQTDNNNSVGRGCWLTSVSRRSVQPNGMVNGEVNLETSEVYYRQGNRNRCPNGNLHVRDENVGYLALKTGSGEVDYNASKRLRFQFSNGITGSVRRIRSLSQQCAFTTPLIGFNDSPFLIAKKITHNGADGGWLRRCQLTSNTVSVVVDEDTYQDDERSHITEEFSFAAFELVDKKVSKIHHFELEYSDAPFTCKPEPITVKACANASCSQLYQDQVSATLSPHISPVFGGWQLGGNRVSQVTFSEGRTLVGLSHFSTNAIRIGVSASTPNFLNPTLCRKGNGNPSTEACRLNFSRSGFIFSIPDEYANKSQRISVEAKQLSQGRCVPMFSGEIRTLAFSSKYIEPQTPLNAARVSINGQRISSKGLPSYFDLYFDGNGRTAFDLNYPEAGKVELNLRNRNFGENLAGSGQFIRSPIGFCVVPSEQGGLYQGGFTPTSAFKKAGELFDLNITAMAWQSNGDKNYCDNPMTQNYQQTGLTLAHSLVAPTRGATGSISNTKANYSASSSGLTVKQSVSEVGVFNFSASAPNFMKASVPINKSTSANIGRFVPASFKLEVNTTSDKCATGSRSTDFTYFDQNFESLFRVGAYNMQNTRVKNYEAEFAKAQFILTAQGMPNIKEASETNYTARVKGYEERARAFEWSQGEKLVFLAPRITRKKPVGMELPYDPEVKQMQIGLIVDDQDGNKSKIQDASLTLPQCTGDLCQARLLSTQRFVQGRLVGENSFGSEQEDIPMTVKTQYWYWDGLRSKWIENKADGCTRLNKTDVGLTSQVDIPNLGYQFSPALRNGQRIERGLLPFSLNQARLTNGQTNLLWRASTTFGASKYIGEVMAPITAPEYLKWYWQWNGTNDLSLHDPRANVSFGRFRGHDRVIYWREVGQ